MLESIGKAGDAEDALAEPKDILRLGRLQKSMVVILSLLRSKPTKQDAKAKKITCLKQEVQELRKLGHKEDEVLPACIHAATLKAISSGS